ncbi:hypothetical protein FG386_002102 [Cryptosporidium ryanae]|uniref:uncharacterized protein n=1 Tax=Cryptosporidium ryanae TaxID=515981 RepID=UPI00351AAA7C|nr:hypothetical protein FG386_002102 [Cryptosporidium ryanae]
MHSITKKLLIPHLFLVLLIKQVFSKETSSSIKLDNLKHELLDIKVVTLPLKNQTSELQMLPRLNWDDISKEEEEYLKQVQNNVIMTKSEEYWTVILELEYAASNYQGDHRTLIKMSNEVQSILEEFKIYNTDSKVQSLLGGNGIVEFNKLEDNIKYCLELLLSEIRENQRCVDNFNMSLDPHLKVPIASMIDRIKGMVASDEFLKFANKRAEGYARSFQLLNVIKERYSLIMRVSEIIERNRLVIEDLIATWNYIINELVILMKDQLKPIITYKSDDDGTTLFLKSGNELTNKAELINSMFSNTILVKYGKIDDLMVSRTSNNTIQDNKNALGRNDIKLITEFELTPLDRESRIETSERLVTWETDIALSIKNILQVDGVSGLFEDIDKDIRNIEIVDLRERVLAKIRETDNRIHELISMESEIRTMWFVFNYLKKDELLLNSHDNLKYIIENKELNVDNQERITYIYNQLINARSEYHILYSNIINEESEETGLNQISNSYSSLKTLMCLNQFYQAKQEACSSQECEATGNYLHYSDANKDCVYFFVDKIRSYATKRVLSASDNSEEHKTTSEYAIQRFISLIFPNRKEDYLEKHSNSPIWTLIQELKEERQLSVDSDMDENHQLLVRKRDRASKIMQTAIEYNELSKAVLNKVDSVLNESEIMEKHNRVREYMEKMSEVLKEHVLETITNKEDIVNVFDNMERVLKMMLEDLSEKSLNNKNSILSLKSKYDELLFLFNDYTAKYNLEFNKRRRIEDKEFLENTGTALREVGDGIEEARRQVEEINYENSNSYSSLQSRISLILSYIHSSRVLLASETHANEYRGGQSDKIISINLRHENSYIESFRARYKYVLGMIGSYNKTYVDIKRGKQSIFENQSVLSNRLVQIENQIRKKSLGKESGTQESFSKPNVNRVRKQRRIAERLLNGYLMLYFNIYDSKSDRIKNTLVALDNVISEYRFHINKFKKENDIGSQVKFKTKLKKFLNIKKFYRTRRYYRVMKSFEDYIMQKREQFFEYLEYSDKTIRNLNSETLNIIDFYLCKQGEKERKRTTMTGDKGVSFNSQVEGLGKVVGKLEPIQILIGDLYSVFHRLGRIEYHNNVYYLESISKLLFNAVKEYERLNKNANKIQKKMLNLYLRQQVVIETIIDLIKLILPATYFIRNYNKIPAQYLNYKSKYGNSDIMDYASHKNKHINVKGWDVNKGKSNIHLENLLIIQRRYINSEEEFNKMKNHIDEQTKHLILPPVDVDVNKYTGNTAIFLVSDQLLEQIVLELEKSDLASSNENPRLNRSEKTAVMGYCIERIAKRRKELYNKLISKSLIVKQGKCSVTESKPKRSETEPA